MRGNPPLADCRPNWYRSIPACAGEPRPPPSPAPATPVYPRVCGGTIYKPDPDKEGEGLSPRVRGNRKTPVWAMNWPGSIPACAGEPQHTSSGGGPGRVYPRVCGGTQAKHWQPGLCPGLSPRVRGNRGRGPVAVPEVRSIPACAGEPQLDGLQDSLGRVYPRVCGGTPPALDTIAAERGLSPRVRGNLAGLDGDAVQVGSIPACAGEPHHQSRVQALWQVYPRVCGGTGRSEAPDPQGPGLSPRVRGNRRPHSARTACHRSIPACAGEPRLRRCRTARRTVYPRVCGGTGLSWSPRATKGGLSPRVRGNRAEAAVLGALLRSIPACAGEPRAGAAGNAPSRVYPRVCGGTRGRLSRMLKEEGLSPRVRGNRAVLVAARHKGRSIPACAGEPGSGRTCTTRRVYPRVCGGTSQSMSGMLGV